MWCNAAPQLFDGTRPTNGETDSPDVPDGERNVVGEPGSEPTSSAAWEPSDSGNWVLVPSLSQRLLPSRLLAKEIDEAPRLRCPPATPVQAELSSSTHSTRVGRPTFRQDVVLN